MLSNVVITMQKIASTKPLGLCLSTSAHSSPLPRADLKIMDLFFNVGMENVFYM